MTDINNRCWKRYLFLLSLICPVSVVTADGMTELLDREGYYVKLPSGDIYLFPNAKAVQKEDAKEQAKDSPNSASGNSGVAATSRRNPASANFQGRHRMANVYRYPKGYQWNRRIPYWRTQKSYLLPPASGRAYRPYSGRGYYSGRPMYLPRFDAAKSLKSGQKKSDSD